MASTKKVTASSGSINWERVKREDPEAYYEFHDDDGENIQEAGGDGAAEQRFLDRVGFKPLPVANSAAERQSDATRADAGAPARANMTLNEAEEWARELSAPSTPPPARVPLHRRQGAFTPREPSVPTPFNVYTTECADAVQRVHDRAARCVRRAARSGPAH